MKVGRIEGEALDAIAAGELPLNQVLELICELVQAQLESGVVSLMLLEDDGLLYVVGGPCVPPPLKSALDGLKPGLNSGNCGASVFTGRAVYVGDTSTDPRWAEFQEVVETFQIRACWSHPIRVRGKVLGSFAISHFEPTLPSEEQQAALGVFASLAAVAIQTDAVRLEGQRQEIALQRALRLESLGLLAGELSHDLNNLLVGVICGLDLAMEPNFDAGASKHLGLARSAAEQAAELCQRFRGLASDESEREESDLDALIEESLKVTRTLVQGVDLRWQPSPQGVPRVTLRRTQIRQLILNLVLNGAEAMDGKGVLRLSTRQGWRGARYLRACQVGAHLPAGHYLNFAVEDEGGGFTQEVLTTAFEPFFSTKPHGGLARGLGLATVAKVAAAHDAAVRIATSPEGTRIEVSFPLPDTAAPPEAQILALGVPVAEHEDLREALAPSTLTFAGCGATGVACWSEEGPFDLLLMDLRCGWETYDELRVRDRHCRAVLLGEVEDMGPRAQDYADPTPICASWDEGLEAVRAACKRALDQRPRPLSEL